MESQTLRKKNFEVCSENEYKKIYSDSIEVKIY